MARVTVEDCIIKVPNRFDLVMLAAQRAREISAGSEPTLDRDRDKNPVLALREIAEDVVAIDELEETVVAGLQKYIESDDVSEDELDETDMFMRDEGAMAVAESGTAAESETEVTGEDEAALAGEEESGPTIEDTVEED